METLNGLSGLLSLAAAILSLVAALIGLSNSRKIAGVEKQLYQDTRSHVGGGQTITGDRNKQVGGSVNDG